MYTADALAHELQRLLARSSFHSLAISGRDALGNVEYLGEVFHHGAPSVPVMVDTDGQRPEAIPALRKHLSLVQVTIEFTGPEATLPRAIETLDAAASVGCQHALVLAPQLDTSDGQLLRVVEQAHAVSGGTMIVVHPSAGGDPHTLDRRWTALLEQATMLHPDTRLALRLPPPAGMR
jgi:hypothetical protein